MDDGGGAVEGKRGAAVDVDRGRAFPLLEKSSDAMTTNDRACST